MKRVKRDANLIRALVLGQPTDKWDAATLEYHRRLLDEPGVADQAQLEQATITDGQWSAAGVTLARAGFNPDWYEIRVKLAQGIAKDEAEAA